MSEEFKLTPPDDFIEVQAQRRKEKLTAAKNAVAEALIAVHENERGAEVGADAIENLIRVIVEENNG